MSLLLDALKKAADDKKKISQSNAAGSESADFASLKSDVSAETTTDDVIEIRDELTLDPLETEGETAVDDEVVTEQVTMDSKKSFANTDNDTLKDTNSTAYTVSDEALSMLIHKTNREAKRSRRWMMLSVLLASLVILISGGVYYYMDMQTEITGLERKHRIAMHSMELKTRKQKIPEKSKIIRNLVSESGLDEKVVYAKKQIAAEKKSQQIKPRSKAASKKSDKNKERSAAISFHKSRKTDPVAEKLERAWTAYENAHYKQAKKLYKNVISMEKNNRDALLGLGAIAVIEKNYRAARTAYSVLLDSDPRDPIAIAALAGLRSNAATEADEKYLLSMLQKKPGDGHLNFAIGNIYAQQGKWKSAQQAYFNAWQGDNENADYLFNLAVSMDQLGKQKQALSFYRDCLTASVNKQVAFSHEAVQKRIAELSGL